jgi:formamidopyrimidine-DNA glycosylase
VPELPEVETTRRGVGPLVEGLEISTVTVREPRLRWPIPSGLDTALVGQRIQCVQRRAKYLLFRTVPGTLIVHLGMSGSLRVVSATTPLHKHDHFDVVFADASCLRLRDPRRFGAVLWTTEEPTEHPLLSTLGPEPLGHAFDGEHLYRRSRGRRLAVKSFIMDSHVVVGVGNIYASESLYRARVHPSRAAGRISLARYHALAQAIKDTLGDAIVAGGTTLRDFVNADGDPGYFRIQLSAYDMAGQPCAQCATPIRHVVLGQRSTFYCPRCQR